MLLSTGAFGFAAGPVPWIHWRCRSRGISVPSNFAARASLTVIDVRGIRIIECQEVDAGARSRPLGAACDPRVHERLAFAVERGERLKGAERGRGVDVAVLVFEISTNLQRLRLLELQSYPVGARSGVRQ